MLPQKLGIRVGVTVALLSAPADFEQTLGALPDGIHLQRHSRGQAQVVVLFAKSQTDLRRRLPVALHALAQGSKLWIAWRKKTSGVSTDLAKVGVRAFGLDAGLVDFKISAIDETWSGLCFTRRRTRQD